MISAMAADTELRKWVRRQNYLRRWMRRGKRAKETARAMQVAMLYAVVEVWCFCCEVAFWKKDG